MSGREIGTEKIAIAIGTGGELFLNRQYTSKVFCFYMAFFCTTTRLIFSIDCTYHFRLNLCSWCKFYSDSEVVMDKLLDHKWKKEHDVIR